MTDRVVERLDRTLGWLIEHPMASSTLAIAWLAVAQLAVWVAPGSVAALGFALGVFVTAIGVPEDWRLVGLKLGYGVAVAILAAFAWAGGGFRTSFESTAALGAYLLGDPAVLLVAAVWDGALYYLAATAVVAVALAVLDRGARLVGEVKA